MTALPPIGGTPPPESHPTNHQALKEKLINNIHTLVTHLKATRPDPEKVSEAIITLSNSARKALNIRGE